MEDQYKKYTQMRLNGCSSEEVFLTSEADGLKSMERFRILVEVFGVSVERAKEIGIKAQTGLESIEEHQAEVFKDLLEKHKNAV